MPDASYTLDRFEDNGWAVLETPEGTMLDVPQAWLPTDAAEGDLLNVASDTDATESTVTFTRDADATEARRRRMKSRRDRLSSSSDGPISL